MTAESFATYQFWIEFYCIQFNLKNQFNKKSCSLHVKNSNSTNISIRLQNTRFVCSRYQKIAHCQRGRFFFYDGIIENSSSAYFSSNLLDHVGNQCQDYVKRRTTVEDGDSKYLEVASPASLHSATISYYSILTHSTYL